MVSWSSSRSDDQGSNPGPTTGGTLEKPSPVGSSHGYQRDVGTHQIVVALDCLFPVTAR